MDKVAFLNSIMSFVSRWLILIFKEFSQLTIYNAHAIYFVIYSIIDLETSILGSGNFNFILSNVLTMI